MAFSTTLRFTTLSPTKMLVCPLEWVSLDEIVAAMAKVGIVGAALRCGVSTTDTASPLKKLCTRRSKNAEVARAQLFANPRRFKSTGKCSKYALGKRRKECVS